MPTTQPTKPLTQDDLVMQYLEGLNYQNFIKLYGHITVLKAEKANEYLIQLITKNDTTRS